MFHLFGLFLQTCEKVYEPSDDTLLLGEALDTKKGELVLDMGTGTGLLAMIAAKRADRVVAADISPSALECAQKNLESNGIEDMEIRKSDLFEKISESFDLIIFNPPYLPTESGEARDELSISWDGGMDGRDVIDRFLKDLKEHLFPGGRVLMIGSTLSNYERTFEILRSQGFKASIASSKKVAFEKIVVIRGEL